jgi:hypothetical protein
MNFEIFVADQSKVVLDQPTDSKKSTHFVKFRCFILVRKRERCVVATVTIYVT